MRLALGIALAATFAVLTIQRTGATSTCENDTVIPVPAEHPELVADCEVLLSIQSTLAGTARLNWGASVALESWDGVTVEEPSAGAPRRVTELALFARRLNGTIAAGLSGLTALEELRLSSNDLTGPIPSELAELSALRYLQLGYNDLSGEIPAQLAKLAALQVLNLEGQSLSGAIPPLFGRLTNLRQLNLRDNDLTGVIPTQLGDLPELWVLRLNGNRLSGAVPTQLGSVPYLDRVHLAGEGVYTGCLHPNLARARDSDIDDLGLSQCAADEPATPETPLASFTLTATAGAGGAVSPSGATTHMQGSEVAITASWNDATHTFAGWSGDCEGSDTICVLEIYDNYTVAAAFAELPAERCADPTDADCIRAVYLGAPEVYAQVQDIPADKLLTADASGRYRVERGQQVTVVTAAPLTSGYDRFVLNPRPSGPPEPIVSRRLVPPVGTTYSFALSTNIQAAELVAIDLHAARNRVGGGKPIPGPVVVTTEFKVPPPPLTLELTSSRELCTANTLTELRWTIQGGTPPYALTIEGESVDPEAESHRDNCGPLTMDPLTEEPLPNQTKMFSATVTDAQSTPESATASLNVSLAAALPAPTDLDILSYRTGFSYSEWTSPTGAGAESAEFEHEGRTARYDALIRYRAAGTGAWTYALDSSLMVRLGYQRDDRPWERPPPGVREWAVAAIRHELEQHEPEALNWSASQRYTSITAPKNVTTTSTYDTVTVSWDGQPYAPSGSVILRKSGGSGEYARKSLQRTTTAGRQSVTFEDLSPNTLYHVDLDINHLQAIASSVSVTTAAPPPGWQAPVTVPTNVRATTTARSITISWVRPPGIDHLTYRVLVLKIVDEDYERIVGDGYVLDGSSSWTTLGRTIYIEPESSYRLFLQQFGIHGGLAELTVTTHAESRNTARSSRSNGGASAVEPWLNTQYFQPRWPVRIAEYHAYTDDPWDWRTNCQSPPDGVHDPEADHCRVAGDTKAFVDYGRFHAGLDIGDHDRGLSRTRTAGDPVYASADGRLRLFKHNLQDGLPNHIVYCPSLPGGFSDKFVLSSEHHRLARTDPENSCNYLATEYSGRTALIFHEHSEGRFVSKYSHLDIPPISEIDDPALAMRMRSLDRDNDGYADPDATVAVQAGDLLGWIGASGATGRCLLNDAGRWTCNVQLSESAFNDPHLHYEVRRFDGRELTGWYRPAHDCHGNHTRYDYCGWTVRRHLPTLIDPESWLPPLPASHLPRDAGDQTLVTGGNADRRVFEVLRLHPSDTSSNQLSLDLSAAFWRPAFYSRYVGESYHVGVPDRFRWQGIMGTRPGIDRYYLRVECGGTTRVRRARGSVSGHPDGEYPRLVEPLQFRRTAADRCDLAVLSSNARYDEQLGRGLVVDRSDILLTDPSAQLVWHGSLAEGADLQSAQLALVDDGLHLFAFRAVPGQTYRFCTMTGAAGSTCEDESASTNVAELLLVGPAAEGQSGVVADGPGLVRDANGLAWTVPDSADATVETYAVVVRRRARYEGGDVPDYSYRLKYTIPEIPECVTPELGDLEVRFCVPQAPVISGFTDRTWDGFTVTFGSRYGATGYQVELTADGVTTVEDVKDVDLEAFSLSHPVSGRLPNTTYSVRVRAWNSTGPSDWSAAQDVITLNLEVCTAPGDDASDGAARRSDTETEPCRPPAPSELTVTKVSGGSATLSWTGPGVGVTYEVLAAERSLESTADCDAALTAGSSPLTTTSTSQSLSLGDDATDYELCVRIKTQTGSPPNRFTVYSDWASAPSKPEVPTMDEVSASTTSSLTLSWKAIAGLSYEVQIDDDGEETPDSTSRHTFTMLTAGSSHDLRVRAIRGTLRSDWTEALSGTTPTAGCADQPNRPQTDQRAATPQTRYVLSADQQSSQKQTRTGTEHYSRTLVWQPHPVCAYNEPPWVYQRTAWDEWTNVGSAVDKPAESDTEPAGTKLRWVVGSAEACEWEDELERSRTRTVTFSMTNGWDVGDWSSWSAPYVADTDATGNCLTKPPTSYTATLSPAARQTQCVQVGDTVHEQARTTTKGTQQQSVSWDAVNSEWDTTDVGDPVPDWSGSSWSNTGTSWTKPVDDVVQVLVASRTETQWSPVDDGIFCIEYEEERTGTRHSYYLRPHVWSDSQKAWIDGQRNAFPYFTDPIFKWSGWSRTGASRLCPQGAADGQRSLRAKSAQLTSGSYTFVWDEVRFSFTVPDGATVTLSSRELDSGEERVIFTGADGEELMIDPSTLPAAGSADGPKVGDLADANLTSLASSLRQAPASANANNDDAEHVCVVASADEDGALRIDLIEDSCTVVRGGGNATISLGSAELTLSLSAEREWTVIQGGESDSADSAAVTLVDVASGGHLTVDLEDGREVARHVPEGAEGLTVLFNALVSGEPDSDDE